MKYTLVLQSGKTQFYPIVADGVKWETTRKGTPSKLTFKVLKDKDLKISEGNLVRFYVGKKGVFYGYVFSIEETKDKFYSVVAYDQLRYLKNKDSMIYTAKTTTDLLKQIAKNYKLKLGKCDDTGYKISRSEDNVALVDIILNSVDLTVISTGKLYVLYDDFGHLRLSNVENLVIKNLLLDKDLGENYSYKTSIDKDTYNQIKLAYDNKETGKRELFIKKDLTTQAQWGVLQYYEKLNSKTGAKEKASKLLKFYNEKSKHFELKDFKGDIRCRAGRSPIVSMTLRGKKYYNYFLIEKATHTFKDNQHTMDLTLSGNYMFDV